MADMEQLRKLDTENGKKTSGRDVAVTTFFFLSWPFILC